MAADSDEHRMIEELLVRLTPGLKRKGQKYLKVNSGSLAVSATPPNTPNVGTRGPVTLAKSPLTNENVSSDRIEDKIGEPSVNGVPEAKCSEFLNNSAVEELDRVLQDLYSVSDTAPVLVGLLDTSDGLKHTANGQTASTAASADSPAASASDGDQDVNGAVNNLPGNSGGSNTEAVATFQNEGSSDFNSVPALVMDEHELIREYTQRLCGGARVNNSAIATSQQNNVTASVTASPGQPSINSPTLTRRSDDASGEEHLLISSYTSTLSSNRSASSLLMSPSVRRTRSNIGTRTTDENDEHKLITSYSSTLTRSASSATSKTSRRSSIELDIESVEEFYETQKQVFIQLQRRNLELRRKIADMKTSASNSWAQSERSESPSSPHSASGQWSTSEYYRYTQRDEQASPRLEGENSPVFGERINGEEGSNEMTWDRNTRLQMLKDRREQLTQQLKQLLSASHDDCSPTATDFENSSLSVN